MAPEVFPFVCLFYFLLYRCTVGCDYPERRIGNACCSFRVFVYHLLYNIDDGRKVGPGGCHFSGCRHVDFCLYFVTLGNYIDL